MDDVLRQVQLFDRSQDFARMYSGGMKRRLSVALSTVGDVEVIFFDGKTCPRGSKLLVSTFLGLALILIVKIDLTLWLCCTVL